MSENMMDLGGMRLTVSAEPQGFDALTATVKALETTMRQMVASTMAALRELPVAVSQATASAIEQVNQSENALNRQRQNAQQLASLRKKLQDEEDRNTLSSTDYKIEQAQREYDETARWLQKNVENQLDAQNLIQQAYRNTSAKIQQIEQEAADRQQALVDLLTAREIKAYQDAEQAKIGLMRMEQERQEAMITQAVTNEEERDALILRSRRAFESELTAVQKQGEEERQAAAASRRGEAQGALMTIGMGAGIAAAGVGMFDKGAIDQAKSFDAAMRDVNAISHMTEGQLYATSQAVLAMSTDMSQGGGKSAEDLARGLYMVQSAGFSGQEALGVLRQSARAAAAGLSSTQDAVTAMTATMNAYGERTEADGKRVGDTFLKIVEQGKFTFPELAHSIGMVIPQAAAARLPINELGGALVTLSQQGQQPRMAITNLSALISGLTKVMPQASQAGQELGLKWFTAADAMRHVQEVGLPKALAEIATATHGNESALAKLFPNIRALRAALALAANDGDNFARVMTKFTDAGIAGSVDKALAQQAQAFEKQGQLLENAWDRLRIALGTGMEKALMPLVSALRSVLDAFNALPEPVKEAVGVLALLTGGVLALVAAAASAGIGLLMFQGLMAAWPALAAVAGAAFTAVGAAITPLLPIIGAVAAAIGVLAFAWKTDLGGIREFTSSALAQLAGIFQAWWDKIAPLGPYFAVLWDGIKKALLVALGVIDQALRVYLGSLMQVIEFFVAMLTGNWGRMWDIVAGDTTKGVKFVWDTFTGMLKDLLSFVADTTRDIGTLLGAMWTGLTNPAAAQGALATMNGALDRIKGRMADAAYNVANAWVSMQADGQGLLTTHAAGKPSSASEHSPHLPTMPAMPAGIGSAAREKAAEKAAKAAARAAAKAQREALKEQREASKEYSEAIKSDYDAIEDHAKQSFQGTYDARLKSLQDEKGALEALESYAQGADLQRIQNRLAAVNGEIGKVQTAKVNAKKALDAQIAEMDGKATTDETAAKIAAVKKWEADRLAEAVKSSNDTAEERAAIEKAAQDKIAAIQADADAKRTAKEQQQAEKTLQTWKQWTSQAKGLIDTLSSDTATPWQKVQAAVSTFGDVAQKTLADDLAPAIDGIQKQITSLGSSLLTLVATNPFAGLAAAAVAMGVAIVAAFAQAQEAEKKAMEQAQQYAITMYQLKAQTEQNPLLRAQDEYQATVGAGGSIDKQYGQPLAQLKQQASDLSTAIANASQNGTQQYVAAWKNSLDQVNTEIKQKTDEQNQALLAAGQKLQSAQTQAVRSQRDERFAEEIQQAQTAGDTIKVLRLQKELDTQHAIEKINDDTSLDAVQKAQARTQATAAIALKEAQDEQKYQKDAEQQELDGYKNVQNAMFQATQDRLDAEKQALQDQIDARTQAYNDQMAQIDTETKALQDQNAVWDAQIKLIQDKYATMKAAGPGGSQGSKEFAGVVSGVHLSAQELSYNAIDLQAQDAKDQFTLGKITQEQELEQLAQTAAKKAALAQKELNDNRTTYQGKIQAQNQYTQAYSDWIDAKQQMDTTDLQNRQQANQQQMDSLALQKAVTEETIHSITNSYQQQMTQINDAVASNKRTWDQTMKAIADGMDPQIQAIVSKYQPLIATLQATIDMQRAVGMGMPGAGGPGVTYHLGTAAPGGQHYFAKGGYVRGGIPGVDSVPIVAQDGEYVADRSLSAGLEQMVSYFHRLMSGAGGMMPAMAGAGSIHYNPVSVQFNNPVVREQQDIEDLANRVGAVVARQIYR